MSKMGKYVGLRMNRKDQPDYYGLGKDVRN